MTPYLMFPGESSAAARWRAKGQTCYWFKRTSWVLQRVKDHLTSTEVLDLCHQKKNGENTGIREPLGQKWAVLVALYMRNKHQLPLMSTDGEFPFMGFSRSLKITPEDSNMVTWGWSGQRGQGTCALYQLRKALWQGLKSVRRRIWACARSIITPPFVTLSNTYAFYKDTRKIQWNLVSRMSPISNNSLLNLTTLSYWCLYDQPCISQVTKERMCEFESVCHG